MLFMPFHILGLWFRGLLAVAILAGGVYLLSRWWDETHVPEPPPQTTVTTSPERVNSPDAPPADSPEARPQPAVAAADAPRPFRFQPGWNKPTALLAAALTLLIWGTLGRPIVNGLTSLTLPKSRPAPASASPGTTSGSMSHAGGAGDAAGPMRAERTGEVHMVDRPDGSRIRVECYGPADAPPVVFTHGWGGNSTMSYYLKHSLAGRYRLIVWDEPGLGLSKKPDNNDYRLEKLAEDLRAVLTFAGRPAVLVGHSIGGMTLLVFSRLYRESLRSHAAGLALVHTTYKDPVQTTSMATLYTLLEKPVLVPMMYVTIALYPLFWAMMWLSYWNGSLHRSTAKSSFAGTETKDQLDFCTSLTPRARPDVVARGMLGMMAFDETATLPGIDVPTLVVVGDKDTTTPPDNGRFIAGQVPGAELATLSPARHMGLIEQHQAFDPILARFADACFARVAAAGTTAVIAAPGPRPARG